MKTAKTLIADQVEANLKPLGVDLQDPRLTSEDIFGPLIEDIESDRINTELPHDSDESTLPGQQPIPASAAEHSSKYELLELIGEDKTFETWKAKIKGEKGFERIMALKKIKPALANNLELNMLFLKEAKVAAALSHPNIVQIYELGEFEGARFLAREFLPGESLQGIFSQCRKRDTTLPAEIAAYLGATIADALSHAHSALGPEGRPLNAVHHHLSPENVIISDDGEIKLLNFGMGAGPTSPQMTALDLLLNCAPEQVSDEPLDHRVDIFSLASLIYRGLTGLDPFSGINRESVILKLREAKAVPADLIRPDIPQSLAAILGRAMCRDKAKRHQTAAEMAVDFRNFLKTTQKRVTEKELSAYLCALREGHVMKTPSALSASPASAVRAPVPNVRRVIPLVTPSRRPLAFFLAILFLGLVGATWKWVLPTIRDQVPALPAPHESLTIQDETVPSSFDEAKPLTEPDLNTAEPVTQAPDNTADTNPVKDSEVIRLEKELEAKRKLLEEFNQKKD